MTTLLSLSGGIIPVLIWLWFWLKEDKINPEPKKYILYSFLAGMVTALLVIPAEQLIIENTVYYSFISVVLLASAEEIVKYLSAWTMALRKSFMDEPVDAVIYMITIALGFSAMENILYLWHVFNSGEIVQGIIMTNMRFIGATVLHTVSSGVIGVAMALSFYKKPHIKNLYLITGIILSIVLHTGFNLLIINGNGENVFGVFVAIWTAVVFLLLFFEKIKQLKPRKLPIKK